MGLWRASKRRNKSSVLVYNGTRSLRWIRMILGSFQPLTMPPVIKTIQEKETRTPSGERIAKVIARAGMCSRRDAERWISEGRVKIDGNILSSPAVTVNSTNKILVDGKPLPEPPTTRLWRYYKPQGLLTTHRDPQGRPNLFEKLPQNLPRLISIRRCTWATA